MTEWDVNASVLDWSPDGEWITFVPDSWEELDMGAVADLWRVRVDGTGLEQLTSIDFRDELARAAALLSGSGAGSCSCS